MTLSASAACPLATFNQLIQEKIVGATPPFVIASLRSAEAARSLAFFVSFVSKTTTISLLTRWSLIGLSASAYTVGFSMR